MSPRIIMTKMMPDPAKESALKEFEVDGVVVRQHPVTIDGVIKHYDVAIFFDSLSQKDREAISNYISMKGAR